MMQGNIIKCIIRVEAKKLLNALEQVAPDLPVGRHF